MNLKLRNILNLFIEYCENNNDIEIYNEAGLQHELAYFIRTYFLNNKEYSNYHLRLEKNVNDIGIKLNSKNFTKKEMDVYIFNNSNNEKYCIEIKLPNKGAYPRRMFQTFEDVKFIEELKEDIRFSNVALLFVSPLKGFKQGVLEEKIYRYFRKEFCFYTLPNNDIPDFIKDNNDKMSIILNNKYVFEWQILKDKYHYFIVDF